MIKTADELEETQEEAALLSKRLHYWLLENTNDQEIIIRALSTAYAAWCSVCDVEERIAREHVGKELTCSYDTSGPLH